MFLRLWARYNVSLLLEEVRRELLRVKVWDVEPKGVAKFRS